jgi:hypothetical protein
MKERRNFKRFPVSLKLKYNYILEDLSGRISNISQNGILFDTTELIDIGTYLLIQFTTSAKKNLKSYIKVVRTKKIDDSKFEIGATFLNIDGEDFNAELENFLNTLKGE